MDDQGTTDGVKNQGPSSLGFLVAHHFSDQLHRCYKVTIAQKPIWICARFLGVYPVLVIVMVLLFLYPLAIGWWDILWLFLLPVPALADWSLSRLKKKPGSNIIRTITGVFLGVSLARMLYIHFLHPAHTLVIAQWAWLFGAWLLTEVSYRLFFAGKGKTYDSQVGP